MFLQWISAMIKAAVLKGFHDAMAELDLQADDAPDAMEALRKRMALPAPKKAAK